MAAVEPALNVNVCLDATIVDGNVNPLAGISWVNSLPSLMGADYFDVPQLLWPPESSFDDFPIGQSNDFTSSATSSAHYQRHQSAGTDFLVNPYPL